MFAATGDRNLLQIQAGVANAAEHRVRHHAARDHAGARHRGPINEPETRHKINAVKREHQRHRASLHNEPAQCDLSGKRTFRAAAP